MKYSIMEFNPTQDRLKNGRQPKTGIMVPSLTTSFSLGVICPLDVHERSRTQALKRRIYAQLIQKPSDEVFDHGVQSNTRQIGACWSRYLVKNGRQPKTGIMVPSLTTSFSLGVICPDCTPGVADNPGTHTP
jgi:hypothetical protein